ncbi:MAG: VWA domain-containing protein [Caldilineaceae bacterium]|nr:VWA domain-containing protein [Caldilineaceae bacterium]
MSQVVSQYISFIWPFMLLSLLLVPLLLWYYRRVRRSRAATAAALGPLAAMGSPSGSHRSPGRRRDLPPLLYLIGLTILLIALARPEMLVSLPRIQGTVILAFDVSNSMAADDLEPNRMDAARDAARAFVDNQPETIEIGVVAFSNGGLITQAPTYDRAAILASFERLTPQGGTSLGQGIFTSLNAIAGETLAINEEALNEEEGTIDLGRIDLGDYSSAVVLLLTDGENMGPPDPLAIAQVAAEAGVRLYAVGIGSEEGSVIEVDGFNLVTALDAATLQEITSVTNGAYYRAEDAASLDEIYRTVDLQLTVEGEKMEVTALAAGAGLLFLLAGGLLSMLWFGRMP